MASQPPIPGPTHTGDNLTYPPAPSVIIKYTYNSGTSDFTLNYQPIDTTAVDYSSGNSVSGNTSTCDPTYGFDYSIIAGTEYWPMKIGWTNTHWDGVSFTYTTHEQLLTTTPSNFAYQPTTSTPYDYKSTFRVWRVV